jgi:hypothetical protein
LNDLTERGSSVYRKTSGSYLMSGIFITLLGSMFLLLGVVGLFGQEPSGWHYFLLVTGLLFAGMGVASCFGQTVPRKVKGVRLIARSLATPCKRGSKALFYSVSSVNSVAIHPAARSPFALFEISAVNLISVARGV